MGAIRPPWITKEDFYHTPFNYCDRWCERCHLTDICRVYQEDERDRKRAMREGKNPNSWEFTFEVLQKNFQKTMKLLYKGAKKWGIDIEEINRFDESEFEKYLEEKEQVHKDPVNLCADQWSDHVRAFLKKFTEVPIEVPLTVAMDAQEVLSWYQTLIPAKVYRALSSVQDEKDSPEELRTYDDKTSAFIAYHGLLAVSDVLMKLAAEKTLHRMSVHSLRLAKRSIDFAQTLKEAFYFEDDHVLSH